MSNSYGSTNEQKSTGPQAATCATLSSQHMFELIKNLSLEIHSLIKQGVREGVEDRILHRNALLQEWFEGIQKQIDLTEQQQIFLEELLQEEQKLLTILKDEQKKMGHHQVASRKLDHYKRNQGH